MNHLLTTEQIIGCCFKVHTLLGPGFPERIYQRALQVAFKKVGIGFKTEVPFEVYFSGEKVGLFRCDLLVEQKVIVELKAIEGFIPRICRDQVLAYLKASGLDTALLVNFGNPSCEIKRLTV